MSRIVPPSLEHFHYCGLPQKSRPFSSDGDLRRPLFLQVTFATGGMGCAHVNGHGALFSGQDCHASDISADGFSSLTIRFVHVTLSSLTFLFLPFSQPKKEKKLPCISNSYRTQTTFSGKVYSLVTELHSFDRMRSFGQTVTEAAAEVCIPRVGTPYQEAAEIWNQ
jgi:hypothetical protein